MNLATIEQSVDEQIRATKLDPFKNPRELIDTIEKAVREYNQGARAKGQDPLGARSQRRIIDTLYSKFGGYGPLQELLDDPQVEEIWINSPAQIFCSRAGVTELTNLVLSTKEVHDLVERMIGTTGRRLDYSNPFVDVRLPGGERLHVAIPPITGENWSVNIRKHLVKARRLNQLVELAMLSAQAANFLDTAVAKGANVVVSGATQTGKTTMVRALCGCIPASSRIITCEEVFELDLKNRDVVALQTRGKNREGEGEVSLRTLVSESLRMRPERIVVGEVRGAESLDMLIALNSGVPGLSTIHANSGREALSKLCTLPLLAGENVSPAFLIPTVACVIDLVVHLENFNDGRRGVKEILAVSGRVEGTVIEAEELFVRKGSQLVAAPGGEERILGAIRQEARASETRASETRKQPW